MSTSNNAHRFQLIAKGIAFLQAVIIVFLMSGSVMAQNSIADNVCKGLLSTETGNIPESATINSCQESADSSFGDFAQRIINIFSVVVGAVSVIMIIIGGFRYIISAGDSTGVTGAKNTIIYAIVGLVIVIFAQVIIRFVLTNVSPVAGS